MSKQSKEKAPSSLATAELQNQTHINKGMNKMTLEHTQSHGKGLHLQFKEWHILRMDEHNLVLATRRNKPKVPRRAGGSQTINDAYHILGYYRNLKSTLNALLHEVTSQGHFSDISEVLEAIYELENWLNSQCSFEIQL